MNQDEKDQSAIEELKGLMDKDAELEKLKADTEQKRAHVENKKYSDLYERTIQDEKDMEITKGSNFGTMSDAQVATLQKDNDEYIEAAKRRMLFIDPVFDKVVPYFRKNLILIGAKTGDGKSTTAANIAFSTMKQTNPVTGKKCRVLILTNEEKAEDFYNRITCLNKGWHYTNHSEFTEEQITTFRRAIPLLAAGGRLTVVDNTYNGSHGVTTTIEGIQTVFENLLANKEYYDVVIIDYYQNIISSKNNISASENDVQARLARMLDHYKNVYPAPIVLMAQVNAATEDKAPFQIRIKGRKIIMDACTLAMEMVANRELLATTWWIWKSRFTSSVGKHFNTGYEEGRFVEYTTEFKEKVQKMRDEQEARAMDKAIGLKDVFKKEQNG